MIREVSFSGVNFKPGILYRSGASEYALFEKRNEETIMHYYNRDPRRMPRAEYLEEGFQVRARLIDLKKFKPAQVPRDLPVVFTGLFLDKDFGRWLEYIGLLDPNQE